MGNKTYPITWLTELFVSSTGQPTIRYTSKTAGSFNRSGFNNPYWQQAIKRGTQAGTNMVVDVDCPFSEYSHNDVLSYTSVPLPQGQVPHVQKTEGQRPPPAGFAYPNNLTEWETIIRERASSQFLRRLRDEDGRFKSGVFFGEIVPTLKMLVRPFGSLRNGIRDYFRAVKRRPRGLSGTPLKKYLGDVWLEYSFGWSPLLADIKDVSLDLINTYANLQRKRISATASDEISLPTNTVRDYLENLMLYDVFFTNDVSYSVKYYGGLMPLPAAKTGLDYLGRLVKLSDFSLESFIPTAWELIPYSFLVDYFSNVGKVLEAYCTDTSRLTYVSMVERRTSGQTIRWDLKINATIKRVQGSHPWDTPCTCTGRGSSYGSRHTNILRWAYGSLTYPGLRFDIDLSLNQLGNIFALLAGSRRLPTSSG